ncbi:thiolase family protein [Geomonas sp. Red32]|uniref:thiolase family protein n=1 Tax=Geomonas sp. Red32 TaxID=2912856 RepID=UPI00202CB951|nr:thiolase family protein [Geomonas sp. Red32]MCM0084208.1 thiolase family protein [Geomonas sp. Red32]
MEEIFVVDCVRTPFGSFNGALSDVEAPSLAATAMKGLFERSGLDPSAVDEVIMGQVLSGGCGQAPARQAMRAAGIPDRVPALTINKVCGSGLKSIMLAADSVLVGNSEVVVAGGMENMSLAPFILKKGRNGYRMGHDQLFDLMIHDGLQDPFTGRHMGEIGEDSAVRNGISRQEQDEFALRSYRLAQGAVTGGLFANEIVPVVKKTRNGEAVVGRDEEPFKVDFEKITQLRAVFRKDGTITAGNASTINDGAALTLITNGSALKKYNLHPKARLLASATNSLHPDEFPEAPVGAIERACARAGISVDQVDLFEINEAFSTVPLIAMKKLGIPLEKINVNGGACAIGHPIGASGARLVGTVIHELHRRKARYGLATLCIGGGEAVAAVFERV